ncbi:glycosyl hydrolase 53 family protein, partial [Candidatus Poribacteria bacterium]
EQDIILVEASYPWKGGFPRRNAIDVEPPYPITPEGQKEYFRELIKVVRSTPDNKAKGIFYWAPEWIPVEEVGTNWGYLTLFDNNGEALPAMDAFAE